MAGSTATIRFGLDVASITDVDVTIGVDGASTAASRDGQQWVVSVAVPTSAIGATDLTVTARRADASVVVASMQVTVVGQGPPLDLTTGTFQDRLVTSIPWGAGIGDIGKTAPSGEGITIGPTSIVHDPTTGRLVIVDTANQRLVTLGTDGSQPSVIPLVADGLLNDVVPIGDGQVVVSDIAGSVGQAFVTIHRVDLLTGTDTTAGPVAVPDAPQGLSLVFNPSDATVYTTVNEAWHPVYDTEAGTIVVDRPTVDGPTPWVPADNRANQAGYLIDGAAYSAHYPGSSAGIVHGAAPGAAGGWAMVATIDADHPGFVAWLTRFDFTHGTAEAILVGYPRFEILSRPFTADDNGAFYMVDTDDGLDIHQISRP